MQNTVLHLLNSGNQVSLHFEVMVKSRQQRKLPVQQLLILSICRFAEPVALSSGQFSFPQIDSL